MPGHMSDARVSLVSSAGTSRGAGFCGLLLRRLLIRLDRLPADELIEPALLAFGRRFLKHQRQLVLIEFLEPFIPGDLRQRRLRSGREIEADDARIVLAARASYARRLPASFLRPAPDFFMIRGRV